jgi:two-component system OmpR family response regulator
MRLLVVEDEARLAGALQRGLVAEGFAVDVAPDGPRGLELARHGEYDAMILDVMLPGCPGTSSCVPCGPSATGCRC